MKEEAGYIAIIVRAMVTLIYSIMKEGLNKSMQWSILTVSNKEGGYNKAGTSRNMTGWGDKVVMYYNTLPLAAFKPIGAELSEKFTKLKIILLFTH